MPHNRPLLRSLVASAVLILTTSAGGAQAQSAPAGDGLVFSSSAFGTLGVARSDQPWRYQRFIRDSFSAERDTVFGAQVDLQINPQWSATVQARLAPASNNDSRWRADASWAFVAWRPDNDWLLRAGKLRLPLLLRSEQQDVGQTYDEARLPSEIYALPPTSDFSGAHLVRTWALTGGDWSVDAFFGNSDLYKRFWMRDGMPSPVPGQPALVPAGAMFKKVNVSVSGAILSWRAPDLHARLGYMQARTRTAAGAVLVQPAWVDLAPGIGFWQTDPSQPGTPTTDHIRNELLTLGGEARFGGGWRVASEWMWTRQHRTELGLSGWAGYVTVYRNLGNFTPYVTAATSRAHDRQVRWQNTLDQTSVPALVPGAALINASMRVTADTVPNQNQESLAIGSSWALTPASTLKAEWLHTRARESTLIDVPAGEPIGQRRRVNVLSLSYSFVF